MDNLTKFFSFELPTKIIYGANCLDNLCIELRENEGKKPIIITDKGVEKAGILKKITDLLDKDDFPYVIYDGVEANPKDVNVEEGAKIARENNCDCIIAVGGGSPIDCAKSVGVLLAHNDTEIKKYEGKTAATKPLPLFITIPTTSIQNDSKKQIYSCKSSNLRPCTYFISSTSSNSCNRNGCINTRNRSLHSNMLRTNSRCSLFICNRTYIQQFKNSRF